MDEVLRRRVEEGLGDARLVALAWVGDDLQLQWELPETPAARWLLCCENADRIRIDLAFGQQVGPPLLFSARVQPTGDGRWRVEFDFGGAPAGGISLCCDEVSGSDPG